MTFSPHVEAIPWRLILLYTVVSKKQWYRYLRVARTPMDCYFKAADCIKCYNVTGQSMSNKKVNTTKQLKLVIQRSNDTQRPKTPMQNVKEESSTPKLTS